ncbi:pollen-specific leucine-rich repeat extensin-like protein 1 [Xiphophorus couchianus]|uniref:pollen-specific leucine-rich repeat extensin-like protein 1 n=1 Tax=Xiphophorus couchianus TaxID=32473 RepID=UPI001016158E|nr:pollen-specific leucine-rich repeat extensin-like protein 1 [Xiphophorus couchianus]
MKVQLVLPLALLTSVLLVGLLKMRKRDHEKDEKLSRFQDIKLRVTSDVLQEYQKEKIEMQHQLEKVQGEQKAMEEEVKVVKTKAEKAAGDLTGCESSQKSGTDQQAAEETKLGNLKAQTEKEKTEWNAELDRLKKQLTEKSPVCNFLKEYPDQIKTMCGIKEEPKAEPPKQEEKKEPPKQEEKKEPPKQEEKKEPPKQEEKKVEPPKQEEKKVEPPKQEEKKEEPPKQEEKKEPPKQEEKKEEPPKQEEKKEEPPKQEEKKEEPPKQEEKKEAVPKQ